MISDLAQVARTRWVMEEGFQRAKWVGRDKYEVRRWEGWYRHIAVCLLACAFLEVTRAATQSGARRG